MTDAKKKEKTYNTQNKTKRLCFGRGNFQCVVLFAAVWLPEEKDLREEGETRAKNLRDEE